MEFQERIEMNVERFYGMTTQNPSYQQYAASEHEQ